MQIQCSALKATPLSLTTGSKSGLVRDRDGGWDRQLAIQASLLCLAGRTAAGGLLSITTVAGYSSAHDDCAAKAMLLQIWHNWDALYLGPTAWTRIGIEIGDGAHSVINFENFDFEIPDCSFSSWLNFCKIAADFYHNDSHHDQLRDMITRSHVCD